MSVIWAHIWESPVNLILLGPCIVIGKESWAWQPERVTRRVVLPGCLNFKVMAVSPDIVVPETIVLSKVQTMDFMHSVFFMAENAKIESPKQHLLCPTNFIALQMLGTLQ